MASVLYISYDGLMEPLGQSQVWQYLSGLSTHHKIFLISYEKSVDWKNEAEKRRIKAAVTAKGITWVPLRYHSKPSAIATAFDILLGIVVGCYLVLKHRIKIVHARSYVPSVIALSLKKLLGIKYIFDMRGFWADERVDGGLWPKNGRFYRISKRLERHFLLAADCVVSLTHAAVSEMRQFPYLQGRMPKFEVITTCANLNLFKPEEVRQSRHEKPFNLGYVGSVSVSYLFDETLQCFKLLQQMIPDARLHILNRGEHDYIRKRLSYYKIYQQSVRLEATDHAGVVRAMCQMDAGIFFIKQVYSKMASAPTKLGEFLGCGIPCLGNAGVGDMATILEKEHVGIALQCFAEDSMREAIYLLVKLSREEGIEQRCRQVAMEYFSLEMGIEKYNKIYYDLLREKSA
jgi:glycosyltransferase involved in cell wall biosynthesis